jgi:hypothetical protein
VKNNRLKKENSSRKRRKSSFEYTPGGVNPHSNQTETVRFVVKQNGREDGKAFKNDKAFSRLPGQFSDKKSTRPEA